MDNRVALQIRAAVPLPVYLLLTAEKRNGLGNSQLKFPRFGEDSSETERRNALGAKLKILHCGKTAYNFYIKNHQLIFYTEKCNSSISGKAVCAIILVDFSQRVCGQRTTAEPRCAA